MTTTNQQALFPDVAPTVNHAADLPRVPCGSNVPDRGCGKPMVWVSSVKGGKVPLDPDPVGDGNLVFVAEGTIRSLHKGEAGPEGMARFKSHFATCPKAADFRRR